MSMWEALVVIVAVVSFARVIRARFQSDAQYGAESGGYLPDGDALRRENESLRRDLTALADRVKVLERIATDNRRGNDLAAEIEALRDR